MCARALSQLKSLAMQVCACVRARVCVDSNVFVGFWLCSRILRLGFAFHLARKSVCRSMNGNQNRGSNSETPSPGYFYRCVWAHCCFNTSICSPDSLSLWLAVVIENIFITFNYNQTSFRQNLRLNVWAAVGDGGLVSRQSAWQEKPH